MALAFIGLGGNMGDTKQLIKDAIVCLAQYPEVRVITRSCMYKTAPIESSGDHFVNAVVSVETDSSAVRLLTICQEIEHHFGRERPYPNAPRTLDLDILSYAQEIIETDSLHIPHPRLIERAFVLIPLLEIAPNLSLPKFGNLTSYLENVKTQEVEKIKGCNCPTSLF
jgi:2-amino-4-hydroxy-6-hydroxymethyldihydropteridine diphosphokinase